MGGGGHGGARHRCGCTSSRVVARAARMRESAHAWPWVVMRLCRNRLRPSRASLVPVCRGAARRRGRLRAPPSSCPSSSSTSTSTFSPSSSSSSPTSSSSSSMPLPRVVGVPPDGLFSAHRCFSVVSVLRLPHVVVGWVLVDPRAVRMRESEHTSPRVVVVHRGLVTAAVVKTRRTWSSSGLPSRQPPSA